MAVRNFTKLLAPFNTHSIVGNGNIFCDINLTDILHYYTTYMLVT